MDSNYLLGYIYLDNILKKEKEFNYNTPYILLLLE